MIIPINMVLWRKIPPSAGPMGPILSFRTSENHIAPGHDSAVAPQGGEGPVGRFNLRHLIGSTYNARMCLGLG